jgi:hypothetical protein
MAREYPRIGVRFIIASLALSAILAVPRPASAQNHWTGIGAISGTVMYMDTTSILRSGSVRRVWVRSLDLTPKTFVAGADTLTFDTVVALNVFDCSSGTRTVTQIHYMLGGESVLDIPETHGKPEKLRASSFFGAIYRDLCQGAR